MRFRSIVSIIVAGAALMACDKQQVSTVSPLAPLNDTGIALCRHFDEAGVVKQDEACIDSQRQDGAIGRDALSLTGKLKKRGGGYLGFDWTKLDKNGQPIVDQAQVWGKSDDSKKYTPWSCVKDNHTGLLWEVKSADPESQRFGELRYTWHKAPGESSDETQCNGVPCNAEDYIAYLNTINFCGSHHWRLPKVSELQSIVIMKEVGLAMDAHYFVNAVNHQYWTSQTYVPSRSRAWYVYFSDGTVSAAQKEFPAFIRGVSRK